MHLKPFFILVTFLFSMNVFSQNIDVKKKEDLGMVASVSDLPNDADSAGIFTKVEVDSEFPGGVKGWSTYLMQNLDEGVPQRNKAPKGRYFVVVMFVVNKDGTITDVHSYSDPGYGTLQEVIRVIKSGPKWIPAKVNGRAVNAYRKQPVAFIVE